MVRTITRFEVSSYGVDNASYFTGGGTGDFADAATGIGNTEREAAEDALESLAQNDWNLSVPDQSAALALDEYTETEMLLKEVNWFDNTTTVEDILRSSLGASYDREYTHDDPTGECYFYVVIRVDDDPETNTPSPPNHP
jgi:hypothetical protein